MALKVYLAMTESEIREKSPSLPAVAWLTGGFIRETGELVGMGALCPEGTMLTVTDSAGLEGLDLDGALSALMRTVEEYHCESILLDFQQPECPEAAALAERVVNAATCPVGVSAKYAVDGCAVLVPPVPVDRTVEEYLEAWRGREIWLELSREGKHMTVGEDGVSEESVDGTEPGPHYEKQFCCHYDLQIGEHAAHFYLSRGKEDLLAMMERAESLGVTRTVGLYQELGKDFQ